MEEEIIIQSSGEVSHIDYARDTAMLINQQQEEVKSNMDIISEQLNEIQGTISTTTSATTDLSEVASLIEDIDTTVVQSQNQDILAMLNNQQEQINGIEEKLNLIIQKLEM